MPQVRPGEVLVRVAHSVISTGTEMSSYNKDILSLTNIVSNKELFNSAKKIVKREGLRKPFNQWRLMRDKMSPLGYSAAGEVIQVHSGINDMPIGTRVACAGSGKANHAEYIVVPRLLVVAIPDEVAYKDAASATLGAIALQGVRRADPKIGEVVSVIGLGLLGQLTVQILKANGCKVIGIDVDQGRVEKGLEFGLDLGLTVDKDVSGEIDNFTNGNGVDVSIITAGTSSNEPLVMSMNITRKKGKVVLVGAVKIEFDRSPFYEKEIDFLISCSYGPGRYDPFYERDAKDYPLAYVRWTEQRNMDAYLGLLKEGKVKFQPLINKTFSVDDADKAYAFLSSEEKPFVVSLNYPDLEGRREKEVHSMKLRGGAAIKKGEIKMGIIGLGGFACGAHLPNMKRLKGNLNIYGVCARDGLHVKNIGRHFGATFCTTDFKEILGSEDVDAVLIVTNHAEHAALVIEAAKMGKAILVEKPLAVSMEELEEIKSVLKAHPVPIWVGFNRRFSPFLIQAKEKVRGKSNLSIYYRMNPGSLPKEHAVRKEGGRIIGEVCHMVDTCRFLTDSEIVDIQASPILQGEGIIDDNVAIRLKYKNGSIANLVYISEGPSALPKEYIEVIGPDISVVVDDYQKMTLYEGKKSKTTVLKHQEKGHFEELLYFGDLVRGKKVSDLGSIFEATEVSIKIMELLKNEN